MGRPRSLTISGTKGIRTSQPLSRWNPKLDPNGGGPCPTLVDPYNPLEEHHPSSSRSARAVLVLRRAGPAAPMLPPDPLEVVQLQHEERDDPEQDCGPRHTITVRPVSRRGNGPGGPNEPPAGPIRLTSDARGGRCRR